MYGKFIISSKVGLFPFYGPVIFPPINILKLMFIILSIDPIYAICIHRIYLSCERPKLEDESQDTAFFSSGRTIQRIEEMDIQLYEYKK